MHIAPDKYKAEDADSDFDFLKSDEPRADQSSDSDEESARSSGTRRTRSTKAKSADRPFPKIRKPVPVTESGAIRAPKAGDPVAPPPPLTDGIKPSSNVTTPSHVRRDPVDFEKIDLGLDEDDWPSSDQWADRAGRPMPNLHEEDRQSPLRKFGYSLGVVLMIAGVGTALYRVPVVKQWFGSVSPVSLPSSAADVPFEPIPLDPILEESVADSLFQRYQTELEAFETMLARQEFDEASLRLQSMDRTLYGYGKPEFDLIAQQIAKGPASPEELAAQAAELAAVEQAAADQAAFDQAAEERSAAELAALEQAAAEQAALEQQAAAERAAAEQAALEQQAAAERAAAEQAALEQQAAAERAAAEQAASEQQAAAELAAAEQAAFEQEAAAELARIEQVALEKQEAASAEQRRLDRISQDRAREEQLEVARRQRLEQEQRLQQSAQQAAAAAAYQPSELPAAAQTLPEQSQTVQNIAAAQRAAAREQRLDEARERDDSSISQPSLAVSPAVSPAVIPEASPADTVVARVEIPGVPVVERSVSPRSISDVELQQVYSSFTQLVGLIERRDISAMIDSTQMSGLRVQQFLQLFENNVSIEAKLRNVSTLDASGEIQGILQVTRLVRADGSVTGPPFNLSSVQLSAVREGNGWSAIRW